MDISQFQPEPIDWQQYKQWSEQWDGVSRVAMRSSEGTGIEDKFYAQHRSNAEKAGIDKILHYHYAYPQFNTPQAEATYQQSVTGVIRDSDTLMLDIEEQVSQANASWCLNWLQQQESNYSRLPTLYASQDYVHTRLQDIRLARYPLVLAHWFIVNMPASPFPFPKYAALQYRNNGVNVPGISGLVDMNVWLD